MNTVLTKQRAIVLLLTLLFTSLHAAAFTKEASFRTTHVTITSNKPLATGSNQLFFHLTKNKEPLHDVNVKVRAFMPTMPGMPAMESKAEAVALGEGNFRTTLNLAMHGTWQLHLFITPKTGKKSRIKTSLTF